VKVINHGRSSGENLRTILIFRVVEPNRLIDHKLYSLNSNLLPDVLTAYDELGVKKGPLKLIQPQFETPLPPLKVAVRKTPTL
jgi:hypothetical protein